MRAFTETISADAETRGRRLLADKAKALRLLGEGGDMNVRKLVALAAAGVAAYATLMTPSGGAVEASLPATLICEPMSTAYDVNDDGVVAGYVGVGSSVDVRAATCDDGTLAYLPLPGDATGSIALAINNVGQVAGQLNLPSGASEAVVWNPDGSTTRLGFLPGSSPYAWTGAMDINDHGWVVGQAYAPPDGIRAYVWRGSGPIEVLPMPSGANSSYAYAINNAGAIAGSASTGYPLPPPYPPSVAVVWQEGVAHVLPPLADGAAASASDINDAGQVVGNSATTAAPWLVRHAVLWDEGSPIDLGSLGRSFGLASVINAEGDIAGYATDPTGTESHAFAWSNGTLSLLDPAPGDVRSVALGINRSGEVVGISSLTSGSLGHAVSWTLAGDTTPPVVTAPSGWVTVPATSPAGVPISNYVSAVDDVDGSVPVTCADTPDVFPIMPVGEFAELQCWASDSAGNVGYSEIFNIHVEGASEQVNDLIAVVESYNLDKLGTSLTDKLMTVQRMLTATKPDEAIEKLNAFINQLKAQTGKGLTTDQANQLTTDANRIKAVIGP